MICRRRWVPYLQAGESDTSARGLQGSVKINKGGRGDEIAVTFYFYY